MSDLRDSGQVEQDADIVLFTYLHEMYYPNTPRKGIGELICRKYRGGTLFSVYTEWQGEYQRFIEVQRPIPPEYKKKKKPKDFSIEGEVENDKPF
jgi:replicative DNA helicase